MTAAEVSFLNNHFERVRVSIMAKAKEIGVANHGTLLGSARELLVSEFLESNLPRGFDFTTGEIVGPGGARSGQIDILVIPKTAPKLSLGGNFCLGLVHATAAALEIKSTLTTADLDKSSELRNALRTTESIRSIPIEPALDPWPWAANKGGSLVTLEHIPVSIVAFDGPELETLYRHLVSWHAQGKSLPNTVTCINRNYTLYRNDDWSYPENAGGSNGRPLYNRIKGDGVNCLRELFDFLMKCLQAWAYTQPRTPLTAY